MSNPPFPGAVVLEDGRLSFALYAPGKRDVRLVAEFNDWDDSKDRLKETDGLWTIRKKLEPGEYHYRFVVDGKAICDPYARQIARSPYDEAHSAVVEVGKKPYDWRHDGFDRPHFEDLIIYELLPYDFSNRKDFRGVIERLDYIADLRANAIQLMPVFGCKPDDEWGYAPEFFFAPRPEYGTPDDLRRLIDECHARGLVVLLDMVLAHSGGDHPFNQLYDYESSPWYGQGFGGSNEFGLPTFDHAKPPTQAFSRDVLQYWIREFHIDGYRLDYVKNIDERDGMGVPKLIADIREQRPDAYIITEMIPVDPPKVSRWDTNATWSYFAIDMALMHDIREQDTDGWDAVVKALNPRAEGYSWGHKRINYVESHDEQRLVKKLREAGLDGVDARRRSALAAAMLMTIPGQPMIYQGQEWGEHTPLDQDGNPLEWKHLSHEGGGGLHEFYRKCIGLRRDHPALRTDHTAVDIEAYDQKCIAYHRWNDEGDQVVVAVNLSTDTQHISIPNPEKGAWHEVVGSDDWEVGDTFETDLEPFACRIWVRPK